ncbi:N-acetylglucosaminyldiphosphodolichol N-acetylglucosaminyltransferase catalytic subunit alg13 [Podila epigama]|nr:N-acetylglucosaminyldiphosphodolichol N-acetylglucosaminyltransferase catalytic subunit alg13 [Podila epigama]
MTPSSQAQAQAQAQAPHSVFVTVGSTRFDKLVATVSSNAFLDLFHQLNYTQLTIQHGQSPRPTIATTITSKPAVECYDYKPSLHEDMKQADLIISHAGSGSILEALRLHKRLIVVVNTDLMDNHQQELGSALHEQGYLVCTTVDNLFNALKVKMYDTLVPFPDPDPNRFANYLNSKLGFKTDNSNNNSFT